MIDTDVGSETDAVIIASSVHEPQLFTALYEHELLLVHADDDAIGSNDLSSSTQGSAK